MTFFVESKKNHKTCVPKIKVKNNNKTRTEIKRSNTKNRYRNEKSKIKPTKKVRLKKIKVTKKQRNDKGRKDEKKFEKLCNYIPQNS